MFDNKNLMVKAAQKTAFSYLATHNPIQSEKFKKFQNIFGDIKYYKVDAVSRHYQETAVWCDIKEENFVVYEYGVIVKNEAICHKTNIFSIWTFESYIEFSDWCYSNRKDVIINHIKKKNLARLNKSMQKKLQVRKIQEKIVKKI